MENEVEKACPLLHQKAATPETALKVALIHTNSKATPSQKESSSQGEERPMEKVEPATQDKLLNTPMEKLNIIPRNAANPWRKNPSSNSLARNPKCTINDGAVIQYSTRSQKEFTKMYCQSLHPAT